MPRLRPPSVHTLRTPESSTSEEEDRADLLGRNFHVPRPKSRSSVAVSKNCENSRHSVNLSRANLNSFFRTRVAFITM